MIAAMPSTASAQSDKFEYTVTPYVWFSGIGGKLRPFRTAPTVSFKESFSEVLKDLDAAAFITGSGRSGRYVWLADFTYAKTSKRGAIPPGIPANGELQQTSLTFLAGGKISESPSTRVELLGGVRVWWIKARVNATAIGVNESPTKRFADPIVAINATFRSGPLWSFTTYGDLGGFNIGSKFTYQLAATANYRLSDTTSLSLGYRYLDLNYDKNGTRVDAVQSGPLLGITFRF